MEIDRIHKYTFKTDRGAVIDHRTIWKYKFELCTEKPRSFTNAFGIETCVWPATSCEGSIYFTALYWTEVCIQYRLIYTNRKPSPPLHESTPTVKMDRRIQWEPHTLHINPYWICVRNWPYGAIRNLIKSILSV